MKSEEVGPTWAAARTALVEGAVVDGDGPMWSYSRVLPSVVGPYGGKRTAPARREAQSASASGYSRFSTDYHTTTTQVARKYSDANSTVHHPGSVARIYNSGLRGRRRFSIRQCPRGYGSTQMYRPPLREPSRQYTVEARSYRAPTGSKGHCSLAAFRPFVTFRAFGGTKARKVNPAAQKGGNLLKTPGGPPPPKRAASLFKPPEGIRFFCSTRRTKDKRTATFTM